MTTAKRVLILSSAVGRFGEGSTGGVSRYAEAMVKALESLGVAAELLVPEGSQVPEGIATQHVKGAFQLSAATAERDQHPVPANSVLAAMLQKAWAQRDKFDRIINLNHDYLPVYSTDFFDGKLVHIPNLITSDAATDELIRQTYAKHPGAFAAISSFQRDRLDLGKAPVLLFGMNRLQHQVMKESYLCWSGRITPEKGLETAAEIARRSRLRLVVAGHVENKEYFAAIEEEFGEAIEHRGYLKLDDLTAMISGARALLQTQNWEEALGLSTIEAIAAGTPVIAYNRGANSEIVRDGVNGYVVEHGDLEAAIQAVARAGRIERDRLAADFDERFSLHMFAQRLAAWLEL